ncbi:orofacial cleft 1 candidate gene 1 protein [Falco rusticolus]|uniref:orofacial cleft 1 candidate gene 1 protein n=1 Tax=Falco rusticolus TaxID=120794 RepID=UPI000392D8CC|nr:orofacial cleft 1 candidate gene 1 protein [Falco rusticolus]XP_055560795.1 orofacial cleft 1 candidate gene 1 protein homolog [Falco cherrug]
MEKEKFQQKALKQTKQKKSKSAEFLMVKEERAATEGIENPAFNISSTDLSAYQPSEEKVIRHDNPDSTLAAHQQKLRLQAHAEPRGNEYSRNYFDPLMDEEINPRQCGMEVSEEDPVKFDEQILYGKLMKLLDEENKMLDFQALVASEDFSDSVMPVSSSKACDLHRELEDEEIPSYIEQFERDVQDDIILLGSFSLEQMVIFTKIAVAVQMSAVVCFGRKKAKEDITRSTGITHLTNVIKKNQVLRAMQAQKKGKRLQRAIFACRS